VSVKKRVLKVVDVLAIIWVHHRLCWFTVVSSSPLQRCFVAFSMMFLLGLNLGQLQLSLDLLTSNYLARNGCWVCFCRVSMQLMVCRSIFMLAVGFICHFEHLNLLLENDLAPFFFCNLFSRRHMGSLVVHMVHDCFLLRWI